MMKLLFLAVVFCMTGCASTSLTEEWRDPGYHGRGFHSALVVGLPANYPLGLQCADEFVRQLGERGIRAVPGNATTAAESRDAGMAKVRELGLDALLVCRFLEREEKLDVYPRETETLMLGPDVELWSPVQYAENPYDVFGTAIYDARSGAAVWTAVSETYAGASDRKIVRSYVKAVARRLEEEGLLRH